VRLQFRTADLYEDTAVLPPLAADSDDDNTDDAVMPPPTVDRTMVPTPSVLAMVPTPSAMITAMVDDTTIVPESSVTTGAPWCKTLGRLWMDTLWFLNHRCLMSKAVMIPQRDTGNQIACDAVGPPCRLCMKGRLQVCPAGHDERPHVP
jgi:hypothetical protein